LRPAAHSIGGISTVADTVTRECVFQPIHRWLA
jgi:hypothetical protein